MDCLSTTPARRHHAISSQARPSRRVDALPGIGSIANNALPSSGAEPRDDNLAVANLRS